MVLRYNGVLYSSGCLCVLQMGDRVGPVGTGEASSSGGSERRSVSVSMTHRQEALVSSPGSAVVLAPQTSVKEEELSCARFKIRWFNIIMN